MATDARTAEAGEIVVLVGEADQSVALVIVMRAVKRVDRRGYVTKRDLVKYGYTDECILLFSCLESLKWRLDGRSLVRCQKCDCCGMLLATTVLHLSAAPTRMSRTPHLTCIV